MNTKTDMTRLNQMRRHFNMQRYLQFLVVFVRYLQLLKLAYDSEGNRLSENVNDPNGGLQKSLAYQYDALSRLKKIINPDSSYTEYTYDSLGNRLTLRNPNASVTGYSYDGLNRLKTVTQPGDIKTSYGYDTNDDLTSVTDANNNTTAYKYDDMGRVYQVISPDTGTMTYSYDPAGNMISKKDAMGVTINYTYDALNRLMKIDFPTDTDVLYTYDNCPNGKGRLCGITDASGTTSYEYTAKGQTAKETKVIDGVTHVTQYSYNGNGDVTSVTYPGGRVVNYIYTSGLVSSVTTSAGGTSATIASNILQGAFGGLKSLTYGNGLNRTITYDNQGRIGAIVTGGLQNYTYEYDTNSNITGITNNVDPTKNKTYAYDLLDRLTGATGPWGALNYTYDGVGNRKTETTATGTTNYTYTANKLMSSTGEKTLTFEYDNNGNTIAENSRQYTYNQNQRLIRAAETSGVLGEYLYNANGQKAKKVAGGIETVFHFDNGGRLIAESDNAGNIVAQYIYLSGQPLAKIDSSGANYIHTDHLGTPTAMTDGSGAKVWEIESLPFGDVPNIAGSGNLNLRFPGQYYDAETGLHYNYFRDYSPQLGRYVEADPIGLAGGINPFVYVDNKPMRWGDKFGLVVRQLTKTERQVVERAIDRISSLGFKDEATAIRQMLIIGAIKIDTDLCELGETSKVFFREFNLSEGLFKQDFDYLIVPTVAHEYAHIVDGSYYVIPWDITLIHAVGRELGIYKPEDMPDKVFDLIQAKNLEESARWQREKRKRKCCKGK